VRGSAGRFNRKEPVYLLYFVCLVYSAGETYRGNLTRAGCDRPRSFVACCAPQPRSFRDKDACCRSATHAFQAHLIL